MSLTNSPSLNRQIAEIAAQDLAAKWGGRLPTWEEFKAASRAGRVASNKTVAAEAIWLTGMPRLPALFYGAVTIWVGFLLAPAAIIAWLFFGWSAWWILGGFAGCAFLISVSRNGHCTVMEAGCEQRRDLYEFLVAKGAFDFDPDRSAQ